MSSTNSQSKKNITNVDLKLKITEIFSKLSPENQQGFIQRMNKFDEISQISTELPQEGSIELPQRGGNGSQASDISDSFLELLGEDPEVLSKLEEANKEFLKQQSNIEDKQIIEFVALPESKTIYRDDEIVAELMDYFRDSETSTVFSNEEKLKLWVDDLMGLVKTTSNIEDDRITSAKEVDASYKPIVENIKQGNGSGVDWVVTVSNEKKKLYNMGTNTDVFHYSVESQEEFSLEDKIIKADPKDIDPETKFVGYDQQQEKLYILSKTYNNTEESTTNPNKSKLNFDKEVYNISFIDGDNFTLDKRILDDGVYRLENIYESKKPKESKKVKEQKKPIAYGRKGITGVEEVEIVERDTIYNNGFVIKNPCAKKEKREGTLYPKERIHLSEDHKQNSIRLSEIIPFRTTNQKYILIEQPIRNKDPLVLEKKTNPLLVDLLTIPISNIQINDKVIIRLVYPQIDEFNTIIPETIIPPSIKPNTSKGDIEDQVIPGYIDILVQVLDKDIGDYNVEDKVYYYKDGSSSLNGNCKLKVIPMLSHRSLITPNWENSSITIENPRVIYKFKCDCDELNVGNTAIICLPPIKFDMIIKDKQVESIKGRNKNYIAKVSGKEKNYLKDDGSETVLEIQITNKTPTSISFIIKNVLIGSEFKSEKGDFTMEMNDFKDVYVSKKSSSVNLINNCIESMDLDRLKAESINHVKYLGKFYESRRDRMSNSRGTKTQIWCKVFATYRDMNNRDLDDRHESMYLVQILQSSKRKFIE